MLCQLFLWLVTWVILQVCHVGTMWRDGDVDSVANEQRHRNQLSGSSEGLEVGTGIRAGDYLHSDRGSLIERTVALGG